MEVSDGSATCVNVFINFSTSGRGKLFFFVVF